MPPKSDPAKPRPTVSSEPFQLLFQNHPLPMWIYDLKTLAFLEVNDAAVEKYGYSREEFLRMTLKDIRPAEELSRLEKDVKQKRPTLQHSGEWKHQLKNGRVIDVEITSHTLEYNGRKAALVTAQDVTERNLVQESMRAITNRQEALLVAIPDIIMEVDTNKVYTWANRAGIEFFGEDVIGKKADCYFEGDQDVYEQVEALFNGTKDLTYVESWQRRRDGEKRLLGWRCRALKNARGSVIGVLSSAHDITERKQAETALRESQERFAALFHSNPAAVAITRLSNNRFVDVNPSWQELTGYSRDEAIGHSPLELNLWADPAQRARLIEAIQKAGKTRTVVQVQQRTGEIKDLLMSAEVIHLVGEDYLVTMAQDLTERIRTERALIESEARLAGIFRVAPIGIGIVIDRVFQQVNARMCEMTGYTAEELIGQSARIVYPDDEEFERVGREKYAQIHQGNSGVIETRWNRKDGGIIDILLSSTPLVADDLSAGVAFTALDITERKRAENALRESEARFRGYFDLPLVGFAISSPTTQWVDANPTLCKMLGYTKEELIQKNWKEITHPDDLSANMEKFDLALNGELDNYDLEKRFIRKDGSLIYVDMAVHCLRRPDRTIKYLMSLFLDITERKLAEKALRENEELLREAQAVARLGSYLLDIPSGMWKSSTILDELFGIEEDYIRSVEGWMAIIHPEDREMMSKHLTDEVVGQGKEFNKEYRIIRASDHVERWVHGLGKLEFDASGHPIKMHGTVQDITDRKRRERELEAEAMLAQSLSQTLELNPLLDQVLQAARHAIPNAEKGSLALMVDDDNLRVRAVDGYRLTEVLGYTYPITWGYAGRAVRERRPVFIPDIRDHPDLQQDAEGALMREVLGLRSAIAVPLVVHEAIIGVLSLESTRPDAFQEEDLRLLVNFAVSTALIIERAQFFEETRRHATETAALLQTSLALTDLNLENILQTIGERASALFESDACRIFLTEEADPTTLRCALALGENQEALLGLKVHFGEGVTGSVAAQGQAEIVNDMQNDPRAVQVNGTPEEEEAIMFAPLKLGNQVIGVMSVKRLSLERPFLPSDLELLKAFASMSASAVSNARLFESTHQRVQELEMLHESGMALNQLLTPKKIGQRIIDLLKHKMNWHHTTIRLYHPQSESFELLAFNQPGLKNEAERLEVEKHFRELIASPNDGLSGWAIRHAQIVRIGNVTNDPRYVDTYPGLNSGLYVPIKAGERVLGVIGIESEEPNAFSEADERLVNTLANQAASAFENSRLFDETRQRVTELATVNRISIALRAITKKEEMLAVVLEETLAALNVSHGSINLLNPETGKIHRTIARGWLSEFTEQPIQPGEGVFGKVFSSKNMHISRDFINDPLTLPAAREQLPLGWGGACVPISSAEQTLGVMLVAVPSYRELSKDEIRLLNTLAEMTGNALHRMELHEETLRRAEEFAALYETNTAITIQYELDALLQTIVKGAVDLLHATGGGIYIHDQASNDLVVMVATHPSIPLGTRLEFGEGLAGRVAQSRQALRISDYSSWENRTPKYGEVAVRAALEVPILFGGELIGVLVAHEVGASERKFTDADERLLSLFAAQAAGAIRSARLREETEQRLQNLQALREVDRVITSSFDLRPILNAVVSHSVGQLDVDAADILLLNPLLQTLEYAAGFGFRTRAIEKSNVRLGQGHAGSAAFSHRTVHISNLPETGPAFRRASLLANENFIEYFGVPLISKGEVKGVLEIFNRSPLRPQREWLELLETMAGQAAIAIDNSQLFEKIQHSNMELALAYEATIEGWSRAMDLRDEDTEGHTQRVTEKTLLLARSLGLPDEEILHIRRGALLHDIGKIGVPDDILLKPGPLTEQEWEIMRKHPLFAYQMLHPIHYLRPSIDIPYLHHEKWDGTGYPMGLRGEQIPMAARIFAIVDVYDALISDRPYRKAWSEADALNYIREQSGKHFDPEVVDKFLQLFGGGQY
ncbi:MAG: PAS domain S-box protein [Chloroflexota bacterium]